MRLAVNELAGDPETRSLLMYGRGVKFGLHLSQTAVAYLLQTGKSAFRHS
jgi:hypothetical protein